MNEKVKKVIIVVLISFVIGLLIAVVFGRVRYSSLNSQAKEYRLEIERSRETLEGIRGELEGARTDLGKLEDQYRRITKENQIIKESADQLAGQLDRIKGYNQQLEQAFENIRRASGLAGGFVGEAREEIQSIIEDIQK